MLSLPDPSRHYNQIYNLDALDFFNLVANSSIDLILTSPPYDDMRTYKGFDFAFKPIAHECYRSLRPGGVLVWVVKDQIKDGGESLTRMRQALYFVDIVGFRLHQTIVWYRDSTVFPDPTRYTRNAEYCYIFSKGKPSTVNLIQRANKWAGDKRKPDSTQQQTEIDGSKSTRIRKPVKTMGTLTDVWKIGVGWGKTTKDNFVFQHPAVMPEALAERHILTWTDPGCIVIDPFLGTGTTAKLARKHGRHYMGCDISQEYIAIAQKRLDIPYTMPMLELIS